MIENGWTSEFQRLRAENAALKAELKEQFEQSISIIHDQGAENIAIKEEVSALTMYLDQLPAHNWHQEYLKENAALKNVIADMGETESNVREILRPLMDVDGDSYGVPPLESLVEQLRDRLMAVERMVGNG